MTMNIRTRIRTLATAAVLALTVVSVSAGHVHAKPRNPNDGPRCAMSYRGPGYVNMNINAVGEDWTFYLPGEREEVLADDSTHIYTLECGRNGNWRVVNVRAA